MTCRCVYEHLTYPDGSSRLVVMDPCPDHREATP